MHQRKVTKTSSPTPKDSLPGDSPGDDKKIAGGKKAEEDDKLIWHWGFRSPPLQAMNLLPSQYEWLEVKQNFDDVHAPDEKKRKLWRIHDEIYDFSTFNHPGGKVWLTMTQGTDLTELFEASHYNIAKVKAVMAKYRVGSAATPRNPTFTFDPKGFYNTLRQRVAVAMQEWQSNNTNAKIPKEWFSVSRLHDTLLFLFAASFAACVLSEEFYAIVLFGALAGFWGGLLNVCAHNYIHLPDSWRLYSFDLFGQSSWEWRLSHVYSHHCFPNSLWDYEARAFDGFLDYLPHGTKTSLWEKMKGIAAILIVFPLLGLLVQIKRFLLILTRAIPFRLESLLPLGLLGCSILLKAAASDSRVLKEELVKMVLTPALLRWVGVTIVSAVVFLHVGLAAGHHHPNIWHAGDNSATSATMDWGVYQVLAVGTRPAVDKSSLLSSVSFGQHAMHHLFPTIDQSYLAALTPIYESTLKEFHLYDVLYKKESRCFTVWQGWKGFLEQTWRAERKPELLVKECLN